LREHEEHGSHGSLTLSIDKQTLAALLGMTPESLSRAFATLAPYGVDVHGPDIRLSKLKDLERLAKPNTLIDG
jgi:CRP/FNR family transcriptional activator FtrB